MVTNQNRGEILPSSAHLLVCSDALDNDKVELSEEQHEDPDEEENILRKHPSHPATASQTLHHGTFLGPAKKFGQFEDNKADYHRE